MCGPVPASPLRLEPPEPELLPEELPDEDASPAALDPELAPEPDPDVEPPLVDDVPELLLPALFGPPSLAGVDPPFDPHPLETPSARARPASAEGARSMALMVGDVNEALGAAPAVSNGSHAKMAQRCNAHAARRRESGEMQDRQVQTFRSNDLHHATGIRGVAVTFA